MSESNFHADLDALVRGDTISASDDLTRFVSELYGEEQNVTMPNALKLRIANDLGLSTAEPTTSAAPVSRRTMRAAEPERRSSRPWAIAFAIAAAILLALTGVLRWGLPTSDNDPDNQFLLSSPAIPTVSATPEASPESSPVADQSWMQPISPEECVTGRTGELPDASPEDFDALPDREYNLVGPADPADANTAVEVVRQYIACDRPTSMLSDRSANEVAITGEYLSPATIVMFDRQLADGIELSAQLEEQGVTVLDVVEPGTVPPVDPGGYHVPSPNLVFTLADGRIIVVTATSSSAPPSAIGTALSLTFENGAWKIDESIPVCLGECDNVFSQLETLYTDALWLWPVSAEECLQNDYLPAGMSEEAAAASRSRQYRACETSGGAESLQSPEFRVTEGEDAQPLADEIAAMHRQHGETPGSLQRIVPENTWNGLSEAEVEVPDEPWGVYQPNSVVTLQDGRIAVLETTVVTPEIVSGTGRTSPVITTALVWNVDGDSWLVDEEVTVCLGNCDSFWGEEPVATPHSTPVALVLPERCEPGDEFVADFISSDRMVTIVRPGPGHASGVQIGVLGFNTPVQYLCESEETSNPAVDRMDDGQRWLLVRTEDGIEGWVREVGVREYEP